MQDTKRIRQTLTPKQLQAICNLAPKLNTRDASYHIQVMIQQIRRYKKDSEEALSGVISGLDARELNEYLEDAAQSAHNEAP